MVCFIAQTSFSLWTSLLKVSIEMDPDKLLSLVDQLNRVLGEQEERSRAQRHQPNEGLSFPAAV